MKKKPSKKKQDKFDRMALAAMQQQDLPGAPCIWLVGDEVAALLRQYHKEVVEIVRASPLPMSCCPNADYMQGSRATVADILDKLKEFTT